MRRNFIRAAVVAVTGFIVALLWMGNAFAQEMATPIASTVTPVVAHKLMASGGTCSGFYGAASGFDTATVTVIPAFFYDDGTHQNGTTVDVPNDNGSIWIPAPTGKSYHQVKEQIELPNGDLVSNQTSSPAGTDCAASAATPTTTPTDTPTNQATPPNNGTPVGSGSGGTPIILPTEPLGTPTATSTTAATPSLKIDTVTCGGYVKASYSGSPGDRSAYLAFREDGASLWQTQGELIHAGSGTLEYTFPVRDTPGYVEGGIGLGGKGSAGGPHAESGKIPCGSPSTPTPTSTVQSSPTIEPTATVPSPQFQVYQVTIGCPVNGKWSVGVTYTTNMKVGVNVGLFDATTPDKWKPIDGTAQPMALIVGHTSTTAGWKYLPQMPRMVAARVWWGDTSRPSNTILDLATCGGKQVPTPVVPTIPTSNGGNRGNGNSSGNHGNANGGQPPIVPAADSTVVPVAPAPTSVPVTQLPNTGSGPTAHLNLAAFGRWLEAFLIGLLHVLIRWLIGHR